MCFPRGSPRVHHSRCVYSFWRGISAFRRCLDPSGMQIKMHRSDLMQIASRNADRAPPDIHQNVPTECAAPYSAALSSVFCAVHSRLRRLARGLLYPGHLQENIFMRNVSAAAFHTLRVQPSAQIPGPLATSRHDSGRFSIDLSDLSQVTHWCRYYGVTPSELSRAVDSVGGDMLAAKKLLSAPAPRLR
jgi:hypothetical protein